ncbi:hypothetical protein C0995_002514 [Termitomyces sp. Mi166|nr:hypothetical protein C0995_002514 [Termitomyces sp. Mi166\
MSTDNSSKTDEKHQGKQLVEDACPLVKLKVDSTGLPLLPQPSTSPFDPLNYPNWLRYTILGEICMLAFLGTVNVTIINPAVVPLSTEFGITDVTGTYQTTIAIGTGALGPLFFTPFANVYGRRPAYLLSVLIGFASAIGSAKSRSYGTLLFARAMNGFGPSAAFGLGAGTVVDVFFAHERGKAMGLFTLMYTNGSHLAPIVSGDVENFFGNAKMMIKFGGYVARDLGWRWCFYIGAILNETLFDRPESEVEVQTTPSETELDEGKNQPAFIGEPFKSPPMSLKTYLNKMWIFDLQHPPSRRLKKNDFIIRPFSMLKYPSVVFPGLFLLAIGVSLFVGTALGELCSSPVTDAMMQRARRKAVRHGAHARDAPAEIRLQGIWTGALTVPVGLLMCVMLFLLSSDILIWNIMANWLIVGWLDVRTYIDTPPMINL